MGLAETFTNLGEDFIASFQGRMKFLGQNVQDVKELRKETHGFLREARNEHRSMGRKLRADLGAFVDDLCETVGGLQKKFQKQQRAVHNDCAAAHNAWEQVCQQLAALRGQRCGTKVRRHFPEKRHARKKTRH